MQFQILSHAGLQIRHAGKTLIFDPWLIGSTYWRSWWNYPPVSPELVASLKPDYIYLTHIHWDHFQGPSLRKFPLDTPVIIPRGDALRMKKDLNQIGFMNVIEMRHGETLELAPGFRITSYQFSPFLDSGVVAECGDTVLFNANDAKFMGGALDQILRRHPKIDFVLRSHSSANARASYVFTDTEDRKPDDNERYLREFAAFAIRTGARYAIPFASNHCLLHRESFRFNDSVTTPVQVRDYFAAQGIRGPEAKVMVSGDSWSEEEGFRVTDVPWFEEREQRLLDYAREKADVLEKFYLTEERADVSLALMQRYFAKFCAALPFLARRAFRGHPVTYVTQGRRIACFEVDLYQGTVSEIESVNDRANPLQIHTSSYILRQCLTLNLFLHLGISKRVTYRCRVADARTLWLLDFMFNMYESEMLPLRKMFAPRFIRTWIPRWRELRLYAQIAARKISGRPVDLTDYLKPRRQSGAITA